MAAVLDIPEVRERLHRWSVNEYERLGNEGFLGTKDELIRGVIIDRPPRTPQHTHLTQALYRHIAFPEPDGHFVGLYWPLRLADSEPEPDLIVVRGSTADFRSRHPSTAALVIEVAPADPALNRELALLYAEAGVAEYWNILLADRAVEVYRLPENGAYRQTRTYGADEPLHCESVPGLQVTMADWFD